jgi:hypothetical protein
MSLTVSSTFKDVQRKRFGKKARIRVGYKRRYFDAGTMDYVYEPDFNWLTMSEVVDPQEIVHQLDVLEPGIFKSSTVTLRLRNTRNEWQKDASDPSRFAADARAVSGYDDVDVIFQVTDGFQLPDGTWEDVPQFTGYAYDFKPSPQGGYVEVPVSATLLLDRCPATKVNTAVTGEDVALSAVGEELSPYTGDGTTAVLKTKSSGVIQVVAVYATNPSTGAVTTLTLTTDYTVTIPTDGREATVTLVSPSSWTGKNFTADVINKDLLTTSKGVVSVKALYADGTKLTQGSDYTVSIPGDVAPAQMTLAEPELWVGKSFTWDGTKGSLNLKVEAAVGLFCDAAGVTSSMRSIVPVVFPGGVSGSKTLDAQDDWEAGTLLQNLDTKTVPGAILRGWFLIDDFSDGDYTADPTWTVGASGGGISVVSSFLRVSAGVSSRAFLYTPLAKSYGAWSWRSRIIAGTGGYVYFSCSGTDPIVSGGTGYYLLFYNGAPYGTGAFLYRVEPSSSDVLLASYNSAGALSDHVWTVTRDETGAFNVFMDGVSVMTATDNKWTSADYFHVEEPINSSTIEISNIYYSAQAQPGPFTLSNADAVGEWVFDLTTTPTAAGIMDVYSILNGGTVVIKTAWAPDSSGSPGTWDTLQALGAGNTIQGMPKQWLKVRAELNPAAGTMTSPEVQKLVAHFTTADVTLSLIAPTSGTAYAFVQKYAATCGYETGVDEAGIFYFRPRAVAADSVLDLDPWTNLVKVDDVSKGWDQVYTIAHVSAPPYDYYYDSAAAGESAPTRERTYGSVQHDIDLSGIIFANDALIGQSAAQADWEERSRPKWRCRATAKSAAWVQLADAVNLTYVPDPKMLDNVAGDPMQTPGAAGAASVALAVKKKMKVIGAARNLVKRTTQWQLQEILS